MLAITGAIIPPNLPIIEHIPTMVVLTGVGKRSDVYEYTIARTQEINSFPRSENTVRVTDRSFFFFFVKVNNERRFRKI